MKYLLDTDHISIVQQRQMPEYGAVLAHLAVTPPGDVVSCIVSFHEQAIGCQTYLSRWKSMRDLEIGYDRLNSVLANFARSVVLPFDAAASAELDALVKGGVRLKAMDLRIASIARSRHLTVVTRNARDFSRVPGLSIVDWTK